MKCEYCGNEIEANSKFCSYCGAKFDTDNSVSEETVEEVTEEVTDEPVVEEIVSSEETNEPVVEEIVSGEEASEPVVEEIVSGEEASELVVEEIVSGEEASEPVVEEIVSGEEIESSVVEMEQEVVTSVEEKESESVVEIPAEEVASVIETAPIEDLGKSSKGKNKKVFTVVGILVAVLAIVLGCLYYYEFKTANYRVNKLINKAFNFSKVEEKITKASGTYSFDSDLEAAGQKVKITFDGNYAVDLDNKIINYGVNFKELSAAGMNLLNGDLSLDVSVNEDMLGFYAKKLYSKYITYQDDSIKEIFETIEDSETSTELVDGIGDAIKAGFNAMKKSQSIKDVEINGKKSKENVITVKFDKQNITKFVEAFLKSIKKNDKLIDEIVKLDDDMDKETLIKNIDETLDKMKEETDVEDSDLVLELVTSLVKGDLKMVTASSEEAGVNMVVTSIENGLKINCKAEGTEINVEYTNEKTSTSTTNDSNIKASILVNYAGQEVKGNIIFTSKEDKTPKVEKVDLSKGVSYDEMTEADLQTIYTNLMKTTYLGYFLGSSMMLGNY